MATELKQVFRKVGFAGKEKMRSVMRERIQWNIWLSRREAAAKVGVSPDTIERRGIEWQAEAVAHRIRYRFLVLDENTTPERRYYEPDVEALICAREHLPQAARLRLAPKFLLLAATRD
jgi:hypothetical protein